MSESMELLSNYFPNCCLAFFLVQEKIVSPPEQKDFVFLVRKDSFEHSQLFFPVLCSNSTLAFLAIPLPFLLANLFSGNPLASILSAICLVESSASAVKISSASFIWSRQVLRLQVFDGFMFFYCYTRPLPMNNVSENGKFLTLLLRCVPSNNPLICYGFLVPSSVVESIFHCVHVAARFL